MKKVFEGGWYLLAFTVLSTSVCMRTYAQGPDQKTFSTEKEALMAFTQAVRANNTAELGAMLGPGNEQIMSSGDPVSDQNARDFFLRSYDGGHSVVPGSNGEFTLLTGKDAWPFPIPLAHAGGRWYWDGAAGKKEVLFRRIGHNELAAIGVCEGVVAAQRDYAASSHDGQPAGTYARRIVSEPGKQNGLYWAVAQNEPASPAGPMLAQAAEEGYDTSGKRIPYHGYYYRMLPVTTGFEMLAFPAEYRNSGVMTFFVNAKGTVYQKDLGANTTEIAEAFAADRVDKSWKPAK